MDKHFHEHILNILICHLQQQLRMYIHPTDNHFHEHILKILNDCYIQQLYFHPMDTHFHEHILNILNDQILFI